MNSIRIALLLHLTMLLATPLAAAQGKEPPQGAPTQRPSPDYSGMYNFLKEGEFVQLTIEDDGQVTGFVSRYGDQESDRGAFLDHFFKEGKLEGNHLTFTTAVVHGVSWGFKGTVDRGPAKNPGEEGYWVMKGRLTQYSGDADKKSASQSREVELKSFPSDVFSGAEKKD
jgi:hypothetical protein